MKTCHDGAVSHVEQRGVNMSPHLSGMIFHFPLIIATWQQFQPQDKFY